MTRQNDPTLPTILDGKQDDVLMTNSEQRDEHSSGNNHNDVGNGAANEGHEDVELTVDMPGPIPVEVPPEVANALLEHNRNRNNRRSTPSRTTTQASSDATDENDVSSSVRSGTSLPSVDTDTVAVPISVGFDSHDVTCTPICEESGEDDQEAIVMVTTVLVEPSENMVEGTQPADGELGQDTSHIPPPEARPIALEGATPATSMTPDNSSSLATPLTAPIPTAITLPTPNPQMCTVLAPATLPEGYTFEAQVDTIDFIVTVPRGGVQEGQTFQVPYPTLRTPGSRLTLRADGVPIMGSAHPEQTLQISSVSHMPRPGGRWKASILSCCEVIDSPMCWQGFCCTPLLLGQIMTRSKLNALGIPTFAQTTLPFWVLASLWGLLFFFTVLNSIMSYYPASFVVFVYAVWSLFLVILIGNTRYHMRQRYEIPTKCCEGCNGRSDDWCCGFWCTCCVVLQMARHLHPGSVSKRQVRVQTRRKERERRRQRRASEAEDDEEMANLSIEPVECDYQCCSPLGLQDEVTRST